MSSYALTLRLSGAGTPPGEIALDDLSRIAGSLQEVATRVARLVVGQEGVGRTLAGAAKVVDLRLSALARGSTVLAVSFGEHDALPFDVRIESEIADRFWDLVAAVESGRRPEWLTPLLSESVLKLLEALTAAAPEVRIARS